jgi:hyperosmotically inducible protein
MRTLLLIACLALTAGCRTNEAPEQQVTDAGITARVKTKLAEDLGAATVTNISVNATNGIVTLAGTVHSSAEKAKAVTVAHTIPKVVRVEDNLQVMATP